VRCGTLTAHHDRRERIEHISRFPVMFHVNLFYAGKDKGKDQLKKDRVLTNPAHSLLTHTQNK